MTSEPIISPQTIIATQIATIAALQELVRDLYAELNRVANSVHYLAHVDTPEAMQAHLVDLRQRISTAVLSAEDGLQTRVRRAFAQPATTPGRDEAPAYEQLRIAISVLTGLTHSPGLLAHVPQAQERLDALWERMLDAQLRLVEDGLIVLREANAYLDQRLDQPR